MIEHDLTPARVLVTGSVRWADGEMIEQALTELHARHPEGSFRVLTGMAEGADEFARRWAAQNDVPCMAHELDVGEYPRPMHNYNEQLLAWNPDLVLAFKDNFDLEWQSQLCFAGTEHMCRIAAQAGVPVLLNDTAWLTTEEAPESPKPQAHRTRWGDTIITVELGDITTQEVDVIVNAANSSLLGGGGVDGAIHRAAGPDLLDACRDVVARQGGCSTGEAVITRAGNLAANHVVHTVGPVWNGEAPDYHELLLARCYTESLELASDAGANSIAFPNISTGVYGFPLDRAATTARSAVKAWLAETEHNITDVRFVCFNDDNFELYAADTGFSELGALSPDPQ